MIRAARAGLLALALLAPSLAAVAEDLSVVSYNVHGLPAWIAFDDPDARIPEIGRLLAGYDVAMVQEEWSYADLLSASAGFSSRIPGSGPRSPWLARLRSFCGDCGSGLALFSRLPRESVLASAAEPFDLCNDWLLSGSDCFATKGWIFVRLRLASGTEVDLVNTHLEAGDGAADLRVREQQLAVLERFLRARSDGRALILGGDLNLAYDDPVERALVERFSRALDLRDTGARTPDTSRFPKRLDYILYRPTAAVPLVPTAAGEDLAFDRAGKPLSDHPAVFARFRVGAAP